MIVIVIVIVMIVIVIVICHGCFSALGPVFLPGSYYSLYLVYFRGSCTYDS